MSNTSEISTSISIGHNSVINMNRLYETALISDIDDPDSYFRIPFNDFFLKYKLELDTIKRVIDLESFWKNKNKDDRKVWHKWEERYFYKPKTFSYDYYGTTELWLAVLRANNMRNISEFSLPTIQVYDSIGLNRLISIFKKREERRR